jgi:hypothetical protein
MRLYDIVLFPWPSLNRTRTALLRDSNYEPITGVVHISDDIRFEVIQDNKYKKIYRAYEPNEHESANIVAQLYSLIHELDPNNTDNYREFDRQIESAGGMKYSILAICMALSRIVHPTTISYEYSAKVMENDNGEISNIFLGPYRGFGTQAYVIDTKNNYLTESDVNQLQWIYREYINNPFDGTLKNALWYYEYAARTNNFDIRWLLCVIALEGILNTGENQLTKQFTERIPPLCNTVGVDIITKKEANRIYRERSKLAHGQGFMQLTAENQILYAKLEKLLRHTILKSLIDPHFRKLIVSRSWIKQLWSAENKCKLLSRVRNYLKL